MNARETRFKRAFIMSLVAVTLTMGGLTTFDLHGANAGSDNRCALIADDIDYARCIGLPLPQ